MARRRRPSRSRLGRPTKPERLKLRPGARAGAKATSVPGGEGTGGGARVVPRTDVPSTRAFIPSTRAFIPSTLCRVLILPSRPPGSRGIQVDGYVVLARTPRGPHTPSTSSRPFMLTTLLQRAERRAVGLAVVATLLLLGASAVPSQGEPSSAPATRDDLGGPMGAARRTRSGGQVAI